MNVLIIVTMYEPDHGPSAPLFTMLSEGLVQRGHKVTVIAMVPNYPSGQVVPEFRGKWIWRSSENGVDVIRVGLPSVRREHLVQRLLQFLCYQIGATFASIGQHCDIVLAVNPALEVGLPFAWWVALGHKPAVYSVYDVYPDVGIKLGIFKHKLIIDAISNIERFCMARSRVVHIISDSFKPGLRKLSVPDSKMALVPLWADTNFIHPRSHENCFAKENGLTDYFVVLYAGNIGLSQGLEHVLDAAELLVDKQDIRFVFVGAGTGSASIRSCAAARRLSNVQFVPFQPRERLPDVLASADVSLVILRRGIGLDSLPSKVFSIMASGRPVLVSVDKESETWSLIQRAEAGIWVPPESPHKLADAILTLKNDKTLCERLGQNGRTWVEQHHSPQTATEAFEKLLLSAVSSKDHD